ncbi:hypothetical protein F7Q91_03370 [Vibrio chagasii]|uniref:Uncharacterized protein n=1 Tax=Vibrio chagasii TaxID=170679 RepID=A0A7V7NWZ6_9VIBR|nr:hypothetical protein [Vibrio chagasii]KAB0482462.1 hypothetical protein F7Q91_03370 [Vibrio chagasii]
MNSDKQMLSLEGKGFPRHYMGLSWHSIAPTEKQRHLKRIIDKYDAKYGLTVDGEDIESLPCHSVGLAHQISTRFYSAAAIVCKAISEQYPNAYFVEQLDDGRFWYLLIIDKCPATGKNDIILNDVSEVADQMQEHYQIYDLHDRKLRHVVPEVVRDCVSGTFVEDIDMYQELSYKTINDAIESEKFALVKPVDKLFNRNPLASLPLKKVGVLLTLASAVFGYKYLKENDAGLDELPNLDNYYSTPSKVGFTRGQNQGNYSAALARDKIAASNEEAKWLSQRLTGANPTKVIGDFYRYVNTLPVNVEKWYPYSVSLELKATISGTESDLQKSPDIELFHVVSIQWRNGGSTVAKFRDAAQFDGQVIYKLSGQVIETKTVTSLEMPTQKFDIVDAEVFINDTDGKYVDILSFIQERQDKYHGKFTGSITASSNTKREVPFKNLIYNTEINDPEIEYITIDVKIETSGYGWSFSNLKKLAQELSAFPNMIVRKINLNLETEEITLMLQYLHSNSILNEQEIEK